MFKCAILPQAIQDGYDPKLLHIGNILEIQVITEKTIRY